MRRSFIHIFFYASLTALAPGCVKNPDGPGLGSLDIDIIIEFNENDKAYNFPLDKAGVKLINQWNYKENVNTTNTGGEAQFTNISAGKYNIAATVVIPKDIYMTATGKHIVEDVTFNASLNGITLNNATDKQLRLILEGSEPGMLLIKQVYYAGSNTTNGASFRDQFIEIYNNSSQVIYADSLYIMQVAGQTSTTSDLSTGYFITTGPLTGQFNWNKSIGMPAGGNAVTDYVYAKSLYYVPGNGTDHPIQPGKSIVIAQTAINHQAPYSSTTGGTISVKDPSLTIDLHDADFEVYLAPYLSVPLNTDVDNPAVPNMKVVSYTGKDWLLDNPGRDAFAIFKTSEDVATLWKKYPAPNVLAVTGSTTLYYQVPSALLIDAVEIQPNTSSARVPKKLLSQLDAGYTFCPAGAYSSQSVIRKVVRTIDGRKILMDTNNSTTDFDFLGKAEPRGFKQ